MIYIGKNVKYLYLKKYLKIMFQQNTVYIFWGPLKKTDPWAFGMPGRH